MKCEKCDREFKEEEAHNHTNQVRVHKGKLICEHCLVDMGVSLDETDPYWTYIKTRTDIGRTGLDQSKAFAWGHSNSPRMPTFYK